MIPGPDHQVDLGLLPWETRSAQDLDSRDAAAPEYSLWMRTPAVSQELAQPIVGYGTDLTVIGTALRSVEGVSQQDAGKAFTSAVITASGAARTEPGLPRAVWSPRSPRKRDK